MSCDKMTTNEFCCWNLQMQVIDSVEDYLKLLRTIFDFDALKALLHKPDFAFTFDAMHGVAGPYAKRIFVQVCMYLLAVTFLSAQ